MIQWLRFITSMLFLQDAPAEKENLPVPQDIRASNAICRDKQSYGWDVAQSTMSAVEVAIQ